MKLGISSFTYGWAVGLPGYPPARPLTAFDILDRGAALGVSVVQYGDNLPLHRLAAADLDRLARLAQERMLAVEIGTRGIDPENLRRYLRLATRLGSPFLRVVVDTADAHPTGDGVVETIRPVMPDFEAANVVLAIENHDRFTVRQLVDILERVDSPSVGICLDVANSFGALEGPEAVVETLAPWAANLHIKDFVVRRFPYGLGFTIEGCPVGQGMLDLPWLLARMRALGRDVNAILEQWTPPEATIEATIAKEAAWATESVAHLRQFIPD